jgi:hypothetical protein
MAHLILDIANPKNETQSTLEKEALYGSLRIGVSAELTKICNQFFLS